MKTTHKKYLLIALALIGVYLIGLSLKYLHSRYTHEAYLKSLPDIRQICKTAHPEDFKAFSSCLEVESKKHEENNDPTARALMVMPPADYERKYVVLRFKENEVLEKTLEVSKEGELVALGLKPLDELFTKEEIQTLNFEGLSRIRQNENFGEVKMDTVEGYLINRILLRPYSGPGFISFDIDGVIIVIKTSDLDNDLIKEKI